MKLPRITLPRKAGPESYIRAIAIGQDGTIWPLHSRWSLKTTHTIEFYGISTRVFETEEAFVYIGDHSVQTIHFDRCVVANSDTLTLSVAVNTGS